MNKHVIALAAALAAATPALAASSATATLSNLQMTLIDLNPADGIAPSIAWSGNNGSFVYVSGIAVDAELSDYQSFGFGDPSSFVPLSGSAQTALSQVSAAIQAAGSYSGTNLTATGSALGARTAGQFSSFDGTAYAPTGYFTLSPYTLVTFEGNATLTATTTVGMDAFGVESALARAYLSANGLGAFGTGSQSTYDQLEGSAAQSCDADFKCVGTTKTAAGHLAVTFVNLTNGNLSGTLSTVALVSGQSAVNAVPEPATYATLVAGLCLLGLVARRRS